ncbi:hypothetical protein JGH11_03230 [Dysgonomonas sp. Marseille-P4677]|uniref:hypothetical protein n=1 Tax=Dysgonomonas sp. Marseille-P4677 TaxID=2364790 RepID=UPI0019135345|nr:hypothetical protein [Dysgonomonas sp. Marseille-P4677]MBK5719876.1 hypothetical protein [Dysgonomonas sp. Marseille-P4677]
MNFKEKLSQRIGMNDIHEIAYLTRGNNEKKKELYNLLFDQEDKISYQAAWVMTHFSAKENEFLYNKQNELIDEALRCNHAGKRRLILAILYKQPLANPPRVDFLDFCLKHMISKSEPSGVQSLCMKLAYELCLPIPELGQELRIALEMMEGGLSPAIQATKKNIRKAMVKNKSLQTI